MDIYAIINKARKQEILQNSISIAFPSFFDQENYEHTSLINLFFFANLKQHPWSREFCQFSPLIIHPFPATFTPGNPAVKEEDYVDWNSQLEEACTIVKKDAPRETKPFRFDTREQRIYLGHHLSDRKLLLRSLVSAVFFSAGERWKGCLLSLVKDDKSGGKG